LPQLGSWSPVDGLCPKRRSAGAPATGPGTGSMLRIRRRSNRRCVAEKLLPLLRRRTRPHRQGRTHERNSEEQNLLYRRLANARIPVLTILVISPESLDLANALPPTPNRQAIGTEPVLLLRMPPPPQVVVHATPVGEVRVANYGQGQQRGQPLIVPFSKSLTSGAQRIVLVTE